MKFSLLVFSAVADLLFMVSGQVYHAKIHKDGNADLGCIILSVNPNATFKSLSGQTENSVQTFTKPATTSAIDSQVSIKDASSIVEIYGTTQKVVEAHIDSLCTKKTQVKSFDAINSRSAMAAAPDVRKVIDNGESANRIDVVFMGDGYTAGEKTKFFSDISRLTKDMFEGPTFKSWLPLFNIWAIHVESVDSGIGYNGAKNTPFKLYREAGQLRAIFTGNAANARSICKLTGASGCDYPSLIANDDYYGGLGGEFVISTKSARTGTVVLRHEMGHNFVSVGEEYDNGQVYSGVNAATSVNVGWKNWLSGPQREEKAIYRLLEYPWQDLSKGSKTFTFTSDGLYSRWYMLTSVTAAGESDSLEFVLDGKVLPWQSRGSDDREFYDWSSESGFTKGTHTLTVRSKTTSTNKDIPRMIASVTLHEFGSESEYKKSNDYYSAYPTWDTSRRKTYRPTNAGCLMRNMTHTSFCNVCKEGMWYQFLNKVSLIDSITVTSGTAALKTLKLGQFRVGGATTPNEKLTITWTLNNLIQSQHNDKLEIPNIPKGSWKVTVKYTTSEIKSDPNKLTVDSKSFTV